ncbi:hypothetical protein CPB83DRAFT_853797 [Crepidotus variabilis]|uniref:NmrA-like domain-containing protein n=1 Tax=Crepidotus variabilis TaxID=179855 RepID=A0A9P6EGW4_9AGAR|nr:hypothetical protein CPB83DRAFT_853797 [Crepidotus variabilis]
MQGGSTVRAIRASSKSYRVRAITRDASRLNVKELLELGCEVIEVQIFTRAGAEKAFEGANVVFGMTLANLISKEKQYRDGAVLVDAARAMNVQTFLWSGGFQLGKMSKENIVFPLIDVKAEIANYAHSIGLNIVSIVPGQFISSFFTTYAPQKREDGSFEFWFPLYSETKIPLLDVAEDFGRFVISALEQGRVEPVLASAEYLSPLKWADRFSKVSGQKICFKQAQDEEYAAALDELKILGLSEALLNMMTAYREVGYYAQQDPSESQSILKQPARSLEKFLEAHKVELSKALETT